MPRHQRFFPSARIRLLICFLASLALPTVFAQSADVPQTEIEGVVVEGQQPGPRLLKLNKDGHVLWILGTLSPLPKRMEWRSREVEDLLSRKPAVIELDSVEVGANFFSLLGIKKLWNRAKYNPNDATLDTVLPPELYARWSQMKQAYLPEDRKLEKLRPMVAAGELWSAALDKSDLSYSSEVKDTVRKLARQQRIKTITPTFKYDIESLRKHIGQYQLLSSDAQIACLDAWMNRFNANIDTMQQRANAWAIGDLEVLQRLPEPKTSSDGNCLEGITTGMTEAVRWYTEARNLWFETVETAVAQHAETLAILPLYELYGDGNRLTGKENRLKSLANRGYVLESLDAEPQSRATQAATP